MILLAIAEKLENKQIVVKIFFFNSQSLFKLIIKILRNRINISSGKNFFRIQNVIEQREKIFMRQFS